MKKKNVTRTKAETTIVDNRQILLLTLIIVVLGCLPITSSAQCARVNKAFSPGECVTYNLYFNWKFIWLKAGIATLTTNSTTFKGEPCYNIELLSVSSKRVDFFFKMRDTLTSVISQRLEPRHYRKGALEGKHYSVDQAWFNYNKGLSIVEQTRTYQDGQVVATTDSSAHCIFDMLSILAQARSYDISSYKPGQKLEFSMVTGKTVAHEELVFQGKENIKADDGNTYRCLVFTFVEYGAVTQGKQQGGKEVVTFYVSDDQNHLPIRLDFYLNFGSAKAFLKNVKGNRYPLTSIVSKGSPCDQE